MNKKKKKYQSKSFGFDRKISDRIFTIWVQTEHKLLVALQGFDHDYAAIFLVANDVGDLFLFWIYDSLKFVNLGLVDLFFDVMDFFFLFKFVLELWQLAQGFVVYFFEVFILDFQKFDLFWITGSSWTADCVCLVWSLGDLFTQTIQYFYFKFVIGLFFVGGADRAFFTFVICLEFLF